MLSKKFSFLVFLFVMTALLAACTAPASPAPSSPPTEVSQPAAESTKEQAAPTQAPQPAEPTEKPAAAQAEEITLKVWDIFVRSEENAIMQKLVDDFQAKHPNVKVVREAKNLDDLKVSTSLALSGDDGPDIVMVNQGESDMGALVKAGLLLPLDDYAKQYGWLDKYPAALARLNRWKPDGSQMGEGNLYGISIQGELVGVFYRKDIFEKEGLSIPKTFDEFEAILAKLKEKGETPIVFGNLDQWPAIHIYSELQNVYQASREWYDEFMYTSGKVDFDTPENLQAAQKLVEWADKGYFLENFAGVGYDDSWQLFSNGTGVMVLSGSWLGTELLGGPNADKMGLFLLPPLKEGGFKLAVGGQGIAFAINAKTPYKDLAAEYINYLFSEETAKSLLQQGSLPVYPLDTSFLQEGLTKDIVDAWKQLNETNAIGYYMDWVTPTMYDTITSSLQSLLGKQITPQEFIAKVNDDYTAFLKEKGVR